MGEGGLAPEYFFRASLYELVHYAAGVRRRYRDAWQQARFIAFFAASPHCKDLDFDNMIKFSWEKRDGGEELTEEQQLAAVERMQAKIPEMEQFLKKWR